MTSCSKTLRVCHSERSFTNSFKKKRIEVKQREESYCFSSPPQHLAIFQIKTKKQIGILEKQQQRQLLLGFLNGTSG